MDDKLVFVVGGPESRGTKGVYAHSLKTGQIVWQIPLPGSVSEPKLTMAVDEGVIVVVTSAGRVFCIEQATGRALWEQAVERVGQSNTMQPIVLVTDGMVLVGLHGIVSCFDIAGKPVWQSRACWVEAFGITGKVIDVI